MKNKKRAIKTEWNPVIIVIMIVLVIYLITFMVPLLWGLMTSFKSPDEFEFPISNVLGLPTSEWSNAEMFRFQNYTKVFQFLNIETTMSYYSNGNKISHYVNAGFGQLLINTVLYAGVGSLIMAFVPALVAYLCAKYKYKFSSVIYGAALFQMIVPVVGAYPSELTLLRTLNIYDNIFGNWIQKLSFCGTYFFVYLAFFKGLSDTYQEAAEIDGASQTRIMFQINMPLALTMMGTVALIQFINLWNDYMTPLLYLPTFPTLSYGIYHITLKNTNPELSSVPRRVTGCMFLAIPAFIIFVALRNKLMTNLSMGGIKE